MFNNQFAIGLGLGQPEGGYYPGGGIGGFAGGYPGAYGGYGGYGYPGQYGYGGLGGGYGGFGKKNYNLAMYLK